VIEHGSAWRWLRNVGIYLLAVVAFALALGLVRAVTGGSDDTGGFIAGSMYFAYWLVVAGLLALVPYLVILELVARRVRHPRRWVIIAGAVLPGAGLILVGGPVAITVGSVGVVLAVAAVGAVYGAVVRLPPATRRVTLTNAD
jgi:hypothetical protein